MGVLELPADTALPERSEVPNRLHTLLFTHIYAHALFFCQEKWVLGYVLSTCGLVFHFSRAGDAFMALQVDIAAQWLTRQLLQPWSNTRRLG